MNDSRSRLRLAVPLLVLAASLVTLAPAPARALQVVTWNILNYPFSDLAGRQPQFRTVMAHPDIKADVMIVQEMMSVAGVDSFLNVLKAAQPKAWGRAYYDLGNTESAVYWDSAKVTVTDFASIFTGGPRNVLRFTVKPVGYVSNQAWFRVYSIHLKAGEPDTTTRRVECSLLRQDMNATSIATYGPNFLVGGDSNFYTALEGGFIRLTESQLDNDGRCLDPLRFFVSSPWHLNSGDAVFHTQSPCLTGCPGYFSGGGMDDRFDIWLSSFSMQDGQGLDLGSSSTYKAFGNDGLHFDNDINGGGFNNAVGITVANALHAASDHLPVVLQVKLPSKVVAASALDFGDVITGGPAQQNLAVSNGATAPADGLDYSFSAPPGFGAPVGSFTANAGNPAQNRAITMDTGSSGVKTGTLIVNTDDPDSTAKPVLLSGRVLRHAAPSLDSLSLTTAQTRDFGAHPGGEFADGTVRVHNFGYDALQARLSVNDGVISGGGGRFSLVGGFTGALLGQTGTGYTVHFDDAGATQDSTYEATLTFHGADEALPGAASVADLVVTLRATPSSGSTTGAPGSLPAALRFYPPRPNPLSAGTTFAFDLPRAASATLAIFDLSGRRVATLASGLSEAGHHQVRWSAGGDNGQRVAAGLYFVRFDTPGLSHTQRIAVLP